MRCQEQRAEQLGSEVRERRRLAREETRQLPVEDGWIEPLTGCGSRAALEKVRIGVVFTKVGPDFLEKGRVRTSGSDVGVPFGDRLIQRLGEEALREFPRLRVHIIPL